MFGIKESAVVKVLKDGKKNYFGIKGYEVDGGALYLTDSFLLVRVLPALHRKVAAAVVELDVDKTFERAKSFLEEVASRESTPGKLTKWLYWQDKNVMARFVSANGHAYPFAEKYIQAFDTTDVGVSFHIAKHGNSVLAIVKYNDDPVGAIASIAGTFDDLPQIHPSCRR